MLNQGEKVRFGFHNLRHSLASFLVRKGTDVKTVQNMLRHSDVATTLGIYAHSMSDDRLAAQDDMLAAMMTSSKAVNLDLMPILDLAVANRLETVKSRGS